MAPTHIDTPTEQLLLLRDTSIQLGGAGERTSNLCLVTFAVISALPPEQSLSSVYQASTSVYGQLGKWFRVCLKKKRVSQSGPSLYGTEG